MTLLHLDTPEIAGYADVSLRTKYAYAARHGFDVSAVRGRIAKDRPASWSKIPLCRQNLDHCDWLWWLDADAAITNSEIDVRRYCDNDADLVATHDANGINCGSFLLRNSDGARRLLDKAWARTEFIDHPWWEQAAIAAVLSEDDTIKVKVIPQRAINSYPENWQPGDLVIHLAGKPNRADLMRLYVPDRIEFPAPTDERSIDRAHAALLYGAVLSQKPARLLEIGIGSGYVTRILLDAMKWNECGELTCVDNLVDWNGVKPDHFDRLGVRFVVQDEGYFLRDCPSDSFDLIVSDADHRHADQWASEYRRVATDGAFMFFHDTNNPDYPNLRRIVEAMKGMPHCEFTQASGSERCGRGWLWVVNKK